MHHFATVIVHYVRAQKISLVTVYYYVVYIVPQSVIFACQSFRIPSPYAQYSQKDRC